MCYGICPHEDYMGECTLLGKIKDCPDPCKDLTKMGEQGTNSYCDGCPSIQICIEKGSQ